MKNISKKPEKQKRVFDTVELESGETLELFESVTEYTLLAIADKLAAGKPLDEIERQMAAGTIRDWLRVKQAQIERGGRPQLATPDINSVSDKTERAKIKNRLRMREARKLAK